MGSKTPAADGGGIVVVIGGREAEGRGLFTCHLATVISCAIVTGTTSAHDYFELHNII